MAATNLVAGFALQWVIVLLVGAGEDTDAFLAGTTVQQIVAAVCMGTLMHVLVPLFTDRSQEDLREDAWAILATLAVVSAAAVAVLYATAPTWVRWWFPGFTAPGHALAVRLTRIQLIAAALTTTLAVQWAVRRAQGRLVGVELSGLVASTLSIAIIVWALPRYGIAAAAWVMAFRMALQVGWLVPAVGHLRKPAWTRPVVREALGRIKPLFLGTMYYKMEPVVDRYLASMGSPGGLSLLYLAQLAYSAAAHVVNAAITVPTVPLLASHAQRGEWASFRATYRRRVAMSLVTSACTLVFVVFAGRPLLEVLFASRLGVSEVQRLWYLLLALAGVLVGGTTGQILASSFYAKGDTSTPTRIGVVGFTIGIALKVAGFSQFGLVGLAAATSMYYVLNAVAELILLERLPSADA